MGAPRKVGKDLESSEPRPVLPKSNHNSRVVLVLAIVVLIYLTAQTSGLVPRNPASKGRGISENACVQPSPPAAPSNYSDLYSTPDFRLASAKRLSGAIQIPTMSFDDMGAAGEDARWAPFSVLHKYLRDTFPVVHAKADLTVVGGYSLVYTLEGREARSKPTMLLAHLDVVPAVTSLDRWTYPPFSGKIDGEWIYGRGSSDCKNNVIGILTAVEHLINSGWSPQRTLILAFGQDEEISGIQGATNINTHLQEIYGKNGIALIVDEGGMGIENKYGVDFALPGVTEKGYSNFDITVDMLGGHSSVPSEHTSVGILAKIVSAVEDSAIFQPHLEEAHPVWGYLSCLAAHGKKSEVPSWISDAVFSDAPDLGAVANTFANISLGNRYLLQTSKAATIFHGGLKVNALPESATATFNSRIDIFSSPAKVEQAIHDVIAPVAKKYALRLNGATLAEEPTTGNITLTASGQHEPSPISPVDGEAWAVFSRAVQAAFGAGVVTAPSAMTGNTDTRFYSNLSRNIYRWSPARVGTRLNAHTVDEKIMIDTHVGGIRFYTELILQADAVADDVRL